MSKVRSAKGKGLKVPDAHPYRRLYRSGPPGTSHNEPRRHPRSLPERQGQPWNSHTTHTEKCQHPLKPIPSSQKPNRQPTRSPQCLPRMPPRVSLYLLCTRSILYLPPVSILYTPYLPCTNNKIYYLTVKTFLIQMLIHKSICASQLTTIGQFQAPANLSAFEHKNKEGRENGNHTKRLSWSSFREAPYRNHDMSEQP